MLKFSSLRFVKNQEEARTIPDGKYLIDTLNTYSFNVAYKDPEFAQAIMSADFLLPDGVGMLKAGKRLRLPDRPVERVAGWDFFVIAMEKLNEKGGKCMFLGSSDPVLEKIRERAAKEYPGIEVITYSPPYKPEFSPEDNAAMVAAVNAADPDLLWIGMTAPKQEKWVHAHWHELDIHCNTGTIGAVFDFYAGTVQRAPVSWQKHGFEWLYRAIKEPRRMWPRLRSYPAFVWRITKEKYSR
ncbi:MAG: WecB/TagA/CpsF family glycosyltransferase [Bacteroidales bacterium]|nr:WecB/TagA/CpsF family glycosyltransferase [Bacteroidales bacterium]